MEPKALAHSEKDSVAVAVEDIKKGEEVVVAYLDSPRLVKVRSLSDVPLGHKIALRNLKKGEVVLKYGEPIGIAVTDIREGEHIHVHNLRSARW